MPGLINVYREGNVAIANAPGAGVADDKSIYAFMPDAHQYYLGQERAAAARCRPTSGCARTTSRTCARTSAKLVVKTTGDSGGYGMLMGPFASRKEIEAYGAQMQKAPGNYIAQPLIELSSHPTYVDGKFEPRRIDLRPFILYGETIRVLPGRPHARGPARRAPTSSTRPRAAAARTPGCWRREERLMLSRVADALYWMGRYLERAENITRLLLVTEDFSSETQGLAEHLAQTRLEGPARHLSLGAGGPARHRPSRRLSLAYLVPLLPGPGNPYSVALLAAAGPRERALGARGADRRGVPGA